MAETFWKNYETTMTFPKSMYATTFPKSMYATKWMAATTDQSLEKTCVLLSLELAWEAVQIQYSLEMDDYGSPVENNEYKQLRPVPVDETTDTTLGNTSTNIVYEMWWSTNKEGTVPIKWRKKLTTKKKQAKKNAKKRNNW